MDFAVLGHRFPSHGRDYVILIEDCLGSVSGQREYVWGTNWSLAYPEVASRSGPGVSRRMESRRLDKEMFEVTLATDCFFLRLVFHSIRSQKKSDPHNTVSQVINRL